MQNSLDNYTIFVDNTKSATIAASRVFLYSELNKVGLLYYYILYYIIQFLLIVGLSHCISWTEQHSWIFACMHIFSAENTEQLIFPQWKLAYRLLGQVCLVFGVFYLVIAALIANGMCFICWPVFSLKSKIFPNCGFIPERGVNFLIVFFLLSCQYLPVASNFKIKVYLKRMMDDVLTLHWWYWIVEHWIDASIQIDGWTVAYFVHHIIQIFIIWPSNIEFKYLKMTHNSISNAVLYIQINCCVATGFFE